MNCPRSHKQYTCSTSQRTSHLLLH